MSTEKRLIDANALVWSIGIGDDGKQFFYVKAENIDNAPTVDAVEVVRGRWIESTNTVYMMSQYTCSECGETHIAKTWKYCPNCGAKMDLED
jgi:rubrerythrin